MFVFPSNSYYEILTTKVMALTGGAFEKCLGHENRVSWMELEPLLKKTHIFMWSYSKKKAMNQEVGSHQTSNLPTTWS